MTTQPLRDIVVEMGKFYADRILPLEDTKHYVEMTVRRPAPFPIEISGHPTSTIPTPSVEFAFLTSFRAHHNTDETETYTSPPFLEVRDDGKKLEARCHGDRGTGTLLDKVYPLIRQFLKENGFDGTTYDSEFGCLKYTRQHRGDEKVPVHVDADEW